MNDKRLYRSRTERMIGGVCGGLADFFTVDPTIIRLIFVLLLLTGSAGFWVYIVLMIVVPEEPVVKRPVSPQVVDATPSEDETKQE
ncbi:MAG: PspC domain-containing protein [Chloroflexi bacterium]|nr:PspC domain-containing protein [Chloroflexota bacterium]